MKTIIIDIGQPIEGYYQVSNPSALEQFDSQELDQYFPMDKPRPCYGYPSSVPELSTHREYSNLSTSQSYYNNMDYTIPSTDQFYPPSSQASWSNAECSWLKPY